MFIYVYEPDQSKVKTTTRANYWKSEKGWCLLLCYICKLFYYI